MGDPVSGERVARLRERRHLRKLAEKCRRFSSNTKRLQLHLGHLRWALLHTSRRYARTLRWLNRGHHFRRDCQAAMALDDLEEMILQRDRLAAQREAERERRR